MDLCAKSSGFADFENTDDRGSAVIFDADCGLCLSYVRIIINNIFSQEARLFAFRVDIGRPRSIPESLEKSVFVAPNNGS